MLPLSGVTHNTWCLLSIYTDLLIIHADGTLIYAELLRTLPRIGSAFMHNTQDLPRIYLGFTYLYPESTPIYSGFTQDLRRIYA